MTSDLLVEILWSLYVNRSDCYALQLEKGYLAKKEPLTRELILRHLSGEITLGVYQLRNIFVKWACLDFDKNTLEDFESAKKLFSYLVKQGLHPLMEMSGGGIYKCHIWIFVDTTAEEIKLYLLNACKKTNVYPHEIFPKQSFIKEGDFGNLVKLPLGIHRKTGQRSYFLNSNFNKIEYNAEIITKLREYL